MYQIYGFWYEGVLHLTTFGCLGQLYSNDAGLPRTRETLVNFLRVPRGRLSITKANWFLNKVALPSIPERVLEHFKIKRIFTKGYTKALEESVFTRTGLGVWDMLANLKTEVPWIQVSVDSTKLCTEEIFAALTLLRTPQDCEDIVQAAWTLQRENPSWSAVKCYIAAAGIVTNGEQHTLIYSTMLHKGWELEIENPNVIKDKWEQAYHNVYLLLQPHPVRIFKELIWQDFYLGDTQGVSLYNETLWEYGNTVCFSYSQPTYHSDLVEDTQLSLIGKKICDTLGIPYETKDPYMVPKKKAA